MMSETSESRRFVPPPSGSSGRPVRLSVVIITRDEENNIQACLQSALWAEDIVVVDAESRDGTSRIASSLGARVFVNPWKGYVDQRRFALAQARFDWVFILDADERIDAELTSELCARPGQEPAAGYRVLRLNHFLGRPIRNSGWNPDKVLRCFDRRRVSLTDVRVHEGFVVDGPVQTLKGRLLHHSYPDLTGYLWKMNRYTALETEDKIRRLGNRRVRAVELVLHPLSRFFRMFVVKKGWKDGPAGFLVSMFSSFYLFVLYAKIWERQRNCRTLGTARTNRSSHSIQTKEEKP